MYKLFIKFFYSLLFLLAITCIENSFAQSSLGQQFKYASDKFKEENYFDAITEFKRLLFFDKSNEYGSIANYYIGEAYKQGGRLGDAYLYFRYAAEKGKSIDERHAVLVEAAKVSILDRKITRALAILDTLEKMDTLSVPYINYWRGWAYIFANEWGKAAECLSKADKRVPEWQRLRTFCDSVDNEMYSPLKARLLSVFIPGAGQFYTGNYLSGLLSLGWNIAAGYFTVNAFVDERIFDGLVIGNLVWLRFYRGNLENAANFAEEKNSDISNRALEWLQHNYTGGKP